MCMEIEGIRGITACQWIRNPSLPTRDSGITLATAEGTVKVSTRFDRWPQPIRAETDHRGRALSPTFLHTEDCRITTLAREQRLVPALLFARQQAKKPVSASSVVSSLSTRVWSHRQGSNFKLIAYCLVSDLIDRHIDMVLALPPRRRFRNTLWSTRDRRDPLVLRLNHNSSMITYKGHKRTLSLWSFMKAGQPN